MIHISPEHFETRSPEALHALDRDLWFLPFRQMEDEVAALSVEEIETRLDGRRVLVVEDEVIVAMELAMELEDRGALVIGPAYTLADALALAEAGVVDAAVLDVDLQGEDVFPAAERLMAARVPFLFHTGHGERTELKARFDGAIVCTKPTLSETLAAAVASLLG